MLCLEWESREGNTPEWTKRYGWSVQMRSMQDWDPSSLMWVGSLMSSSKLFDINSSLKSSPSLDSESPSQKRGVLALKCPDSMMAEVFFFYLSSQGWFRGKLCNFSVRPWVCLDGGRISQRKFLFKVIIVSSFYHYHRQVRCGLILMSSFSQ